MTRNEILQAIIDGEEFESSYSSTFWKSCTENEVMRSIADGVNPVCFRIKQKTITVNGWEIVAGETKSPNKGSRYYVATPTNEFFFLDYSWTGDVMDISWLSRGIAHLTKENAIAHAKAMLGIDPNSPNQD